MYIRITFEEHIISPSSAFSHKLFIIAKYIFNITEFSVPQRNAKVAARLYQGKEQYCYIIHPPLMWLECL